MKNRENNITVYDFATETILCEAKVHRVQHKQMSAANLKRYKRCLGVSSNAYKDSNYSILINKAYYILLVSYKPP